MSGTIECTPCTRRFRMTVGSPPAIFRSSASGRRDEVKMRPSRRGSERRSSSRSNSSDSWESLRVTTNPLSVAAAWQPRITRKLKGLVMSATAKPTTVGVVRSGRRAALRLR